MKKLLLFLTVVLFSYYFGYTQNTFIVDLSGNADYSSIQNAIDYASEGDTIIVNAGIYYENVNFLGKNLIVGSLFLTTEDTSYIHQTIIDGDNSGTTVSFINGETSDTKLTGFLIQNGSGTSIESNVWGGNILCENNANPTISYCTITGGHAKYGGGLACNSANFNLINCRLTENWANIGGCIFTSAYSFSIEQCCIDNNWTTTGGAGGLLISESNGIIKNSLIVDNEGSDNYGGINFTNSSSVEIENCVIANNSAPYSGGGISLNNNSSITILNSVIWNNSPDNIHFYPTNNSCQLTVNYSIVDGSEAGIETNNNGTVNWGNGNLEIDPFFVDTNNDNYHLLANSPAIDAGDPTSDFQNEPNPNGERINIGAYGNTKEATLSLGEGLIAYYPFNGNANDESGNNYHAVNNGATLINDRFGNANCAYEFDALNDFIDPPYPVLNSQSFSFCSWFKSYGLNPNEDNQSVFGGRTGNTTTIIYNMIEFNNEDSIYAQIKGSNGGERPTVDTNLNYLDNQWHFWVITSDDQNFNLFIDGTLIESIPQTTSGDLTQYAVIGSYSDNNISYNSYFNGIIDDVLIYNRALSENEIIKLYNISVDSDTCYYTVYDTVVINIFDTTYFEIIDTIFITDTLFHDIFDTTLVDIFDTTFVNVFDTLLIDIYDTTFVDVFDTTFNEVFDTTLITTYDTLLYEIFDTTLITIYDTVLYEVFDTILVTVYDSVFIYDTIGVVIMDEFTDVIEVNGNEYVINIYPNPANYILNIELLLGTIERFEMYNEQGVLVESIVCNCNIANLDISNYISGTYIMKIFSLRGDVMSAPVIITHY